MGLKPNKQTKNINWQSTLNIKQYWAKERWEKSLTISKTSREFIYLKLPCMFLKLTWHQCKSPSCLLTNTRPAVTWFSLDSQEARTCESLIEFSVPCLSHGTVPAQKPNIVWHWIIQTCSTCIISNMYRVGTVNLHAHASTHVHFENRAGSRLMSSLKSYLSTVSQTVFSRKCEW